MTEQIINPVPETNTDEIIRDLERLIFENNLAEEFFSVFEGRTDKYGGLTGKGSGVCIKRELTVSVIDEHLRGYRSVGVYPLRDDGTIHWSVVDFDFNGEPNQIELSEKYAFEFRDKLFELGIKSCWFERSKSGKIHLWLFFDGWVEARKVRAVLFHIARELNITIRNGVVEIFPKQDSLKEGSLGNYVHLPYLGGLIDDNLDRRVMIDINTMKPIPLTTFIQQVKNSLLSPEEVDEVFESLSKEEVRTNDRQIHNDYEPGEKIEKLGDKDEEKTIEVLGKYWKEGTRQDLALHLAGFLAKRGVSWEYTADLIIKIAELCRDDEIKQRIGAIKSTFVKVQKGEEVKGYTGLQEILSTEDLGSLNKIFSSSSSKSERELKPLTVGEIKSMPTNSDRFIIKGIPIAIRKGISIITAPPGAGKTWVTLDIAKCVSKGEPFLETYETTQGKVAYFDEENSVDELKERLNLLNFPDNNNCGFYLLKGISIERDSKELMNIAQNVDLMIFDSLPHFHNRNENKSGEMKKVMEKLKKIANQCNIAIVLIHHVNKPGPNEQNQPYRVRRSIQNQLYRARGSMQILYDCDTAFTIETISNNERIIQNVKNRVGKPHPPFRFEIHNFTEDGEEKIKLNYLGEDGESGLKKDRTPTLVQVILRENSSLRYSLRSSFPSM